MRLPRRASLLFVLNLLDAFLTLYWVRNGFATEGNHLMASLLDVGDFPFLSVKILVGSVAAFVFFRWRHLRVSYYGTYFTLAIYAGLMVVHLATGLSAFGFISQNFLNDISNWSRAILSI